MPSPSSATRLAVLSDVHGNASALEAVLDELRSVSVDVIVFGGDLSWGPLPEATIALVRDLQVPAVFVRGNAERALLEPAAEPSEREQWLRERHSSEAMSFLATFVEHASIEVEGLGRVRFCHGSPRSDEELVTPATSEERIRAMMAGVPERILVTAHTHIQFDRRVAGIRSINAGSVGMPYEGQPGAYWALLGPDVELRRTEYSLDLAADMLRRVRGPEDRGDGQRPPHTPHPRRGDRATRSGLDPPAEPGRASGSRPAPGTTEGRSRGPQSLVRDTGRTRTAVARFAGARLAARPRCREGPREESNLCARVRSPVLFQLSYGGRVRSPGGPPRGGDSLPVVVGASGAVESCRYCDSSS